MPLPPRPSALAAQAQVQQSRAASSSVSRSHAAASSSSPLRNHASANTIAALKEEAEEGGNGSHSGAMQCDPLKLVLDSDHTHMHVDLETASPQHHTRCYLSASTIKGHGFKTNQKVLIVLGRSGEEGKMNGSGTLTKGKMFFIKHVWPLNGFPSDAVYLPRYHGWQERESQVLLEGHGKKAWVEHDRASLYALPSSAHAVPALTKLRAEVVSRSEAQIHRLHKEEKVLLNALLNMRLEHQNLVLPDQEEEFSIGHARFVVRLKFDDPTGEREEVVGGTSSQPRTSQAKDVHPLTSSIRRVDSQTRYRICIPPADSARVSSDVPARRQAASISGAEEASASSKKAYEGLGGLDAPIEDLRKLVEMPLLRPDVFRTYGLRPPSGVLLYGPPGTGKTSLASACAQSLGLSSSSIIHLSGPSLSSSLHGRTESRLRKVFSTAKKRAPSVIIIDEIDALAPRREAGAGNDAAGEVERRVVATLLTLMDGLGKEEDEGNVIVIAATNRPNALDPALRRPGRLDREIEIGVPTPSSRLSILKVLLRHVPHALSDEEISRLAQTTHGFVGADLASLVREAGMLAVQRQLVSTSSSTFKEAPKSIDSATDSLRALTLATSTISEHESEVLPKVDASGVLDWRDFTSAKLHVRPSALREVIQTLPTVSWSDIGVGSPDSDSYRIRKEIREVVEWPIKRSKQLKRMGVRPPKGALLYGPPGCSKTLIARALATESGINFVAVKGNELYNKFVGESERALREVFARARAASPSIIFFDELDALCSTRGDQGGAVSDGVIATLLTEMDGVDSLDGVVVIAATNRPQAIDPAILRPGRLDRLLYVGPPDEDTRLQILRIRTRSMPLGDKVDLLAIARATSGHSGAEMVAICQDAGMVALDEDMDIEHVHQRHFESAIRSTKKRISLEMIRGLEKWRDQVGV